MNTAHRLLPDEPNAPRRYCAGLHQFLAHRSRVSLLIAQLAHKPTSRDRDSRMLAAIYFVRGSDVAGEPA